MPLYFTFSEKENVAHAFSFMIIGLLGFALASGTPAVAQTADDAFRFSQSAPAVSGRSMGMGGAGIVAGRDTPSALFRNPAGLGYTSGLTVRASIGGLRSQTTSAYQIFQESPIFEAEDERFRGGHGHAAVAYRLPTHRPIVLGAGFLRQRTFTQTLDYNGENSASSVTDTFLPGEDEYTAASDGLQFTSPLSRAAYRAGAIELFEPLLLDGEYPFRQAVRPGRRVQQYGHTHRRGAVNRASLGGSIRVASNILVGMSVHAAFGQQESEQTIVENDLEGEDTYSVITDAGLLQDFEALEFRERAVHTLRGAGAQAGISADLTSRIRLGAAFETPTWYSVEIESSAPFIRTRFANGSLTHSSSGRRSSSYTLRTPWRLNVGATFHTGPLLLSAEAEASDASHMKWSDETSTSRTANDEIEEQYGLTVAWRGGAEVQVTERLTLRSGGGYRPDGRDVDFVLANSTRADRSRLFLSAGASYQVGDRVAVHIAWMRERFRDQTALYPSISPPNEPTSIAAPLVDGKTIRHRLHTGVQILL